MYTIWHQTRGGLFWFFQNGQIDSCIYSIGAGLVDCPHVQTWWHTFTKLVRITFWSKIYWKCVSRAALKKKQFGYSITSYYLITQQHTLAYYYIIMHYMTLKHPSSSTSTTEEHRTVRGVSNKEDVYEPPGLSMTFMAPGSLTRSLSEYTTGGWLNMDRLTTALNVNVQLGSWV
jgi:hypothetical protein